MSNFSTFAKKVHDNYAVMSKHELFTTVDGSALADAYQNYFPEGTNNIFRVKREYECSTCRNFIKNIGPLVAFIGGKRMSVWDFAEGELEYPYNIVAQKMSEHVHATPITNVFRTPRGLSVFGSKVTYEPKTETNNGPLTWNHFYAEVATPHMLTADQIGPFLGQQTTTYQVTKRGLDELSESAITAVSDLINEGILYRGEEHKSAIHRFSTLKALYSVIENEQQKADYIWRTLNPQNRFRNTVIGTLVTDISDGVPIETAVASFESKVAPANYKRPKALYTKAMGEAAMQALIDSGKEHSIERRFAKISDVPVDQVLWVNPKVRNKLKGGLADLINSGATVPATVSKKQHLIEECSIERFMAIMSTGVEALELEITNAHLPNFMSLTAPVHENSGNLFKWDNDFAWSYSGNVADSFVTERVKAAGGNVANAKLRFSLAWFNKDDLDLHVKCPDGTNIYYGYPWEKATDLTALDVDANRSAPFTKTPVENTSLIQPKDGVYVVTVDNFSQRETNNPGFVLEVASAAGVKQFTHKKVAGSNIKCLCVTYERGTVVDVKITSPNLVGGDISQDVWGVKTQTFVPVSTIMMSPNYWTDKPTGNKHWFFMLENCKSNEPTRGIYNEFLSSDMEKHRKVFEVLGSKTMCQPTDDQLSGVGFSSTRRQTVKAYVTRSGKRELFEIYF